MSFVGLDPELTRALSATMRVAATEADGLQGEVTAAITLSELDSAVPALLAIEGQGLEQVGIVLTARADIAEGFVIDPAALARDLGLPLAEVEAAIAELTEPEVDLTDSPLLDVVTDTTLSAEADLDAISDALGIPRPVLDLQIQALALQGIVERADVLEALAGADGIQISSTADLLESFDQTLSADVVARLDSFFLPAFLSGRAIDPGDLTFQQNRDLRELSEALGGRDEEITYSYTYYSSSDKEDRERTKTGSLVDKTAPTDRVLDFINERLYNGLVFTTTTQAVGANLDRFASGKVSLQEASEASGLSEQELSRSLGLVAEAQFRRTGERVDLGFLQAVAPARAGDSLNGDVVLAGGSVLAVSSDRVSEEPSLDFSSFSDDELSSELEDITKSTSFKEDALAHTTFTSTVGAGVLGAVSIGTAFFGPVGVGISVIAGSMALVHDVVARNRIEALDRDIRDLKERQDQLQQEQLDRALEDVDDFDIDTEDLREIDDTIAALDDAIAELDNQRADRVDGGFLASAAGTAQTGILGAASATAKGVDALATGGVGFGLGSIGFALQQFLDAEDLSKREKIDELLELKEKFRRQQLREVGDPAGVFNEQEAVEALADAEFELSQEIERAEKSRAAAIADREQQEAAEQQARDEARERERKREEKRERDERSEPNGGQVRGADPGVGRNDVPDSF